MALTANISRAFGVAPAPVFIRVPCADGSSAAIRFYRGAALSMASGYAKRLAGADTVFLGFCEEDFNHTGAAGTKYVTVRACGSVQLAIAGTLAVTDFGAAMYATDDNTFKKTSTSALKIGNLLQFVSTTEGIVNFYSDALLVA